MRIVLFTSLFPNHRQPLHGVFVEQRLRHLLASGEVHATVVAPMPSSIPGRQFPVEQRHGVTIHHPGFLHMPGLGMFTAPITMALGAWPLLQRINREEGFDLLDAHYFYPDGVAAALLAQWLNKPLVITGRGTDLNLLPDYPLPRALIRWAAQRAHGLITVCNALQEPLLAMGIPQERLTVLRNGVDLQRFHPVERQTARQNLGLDRPTLLTVGHLIPRKGHAIILRALPLLPECILLIVGKGGEEPTLKRLANDLGVAQRVRWVGAIPQEGLKEYYTAADVLILASQREGWANCLLEAMACGTPVAATNIWGTPDVVCSPAAGLLMAEATPAALAATCQQLLKAPPDRQATRRHAEAFSWEATTQGQLKLFRKILMS